MPPSFREREDAVCMSPIDKVVPCDRRSSPRPRPCLADAAVCCASAPRIFLDPPFPCRHDRHPITLFHMSRRVSRPLPRLPVFCLRVGKLRMGEERPWITMLGTMYGFNPYVRLDFLIYAIIPVRGIWKLIVCDEPRIGRQLNEKVKLVKNSVCD